MKSWRSKFITANIVYNRTLTIKTKHYKQFKIYKMKIQQNRCYKHLKK